MSSVPQEQSPVPLYHGTERTPGSSQLHRWADWAELLCYTADDGRISIPELSARIKDRRDQLPLEWNDTHEPDDDAIDALVEALASEDDDGAYDDPPLPDDPGIDVNDSNAREQFSHSIRNRADDVLKLIIQRQDRFGGSYPFVVHKASRVIERRAPTSTRDLYIFLLTCSSFKYVEDAAVQLRFASGFEFLSHVAASNYLPSEAVVRLFGMNSYLPNVHYTGLLIEKIRSLASDLGLDVIAREKDLEKNNRGDGGLDLVAWIPLGDSLPGAPTFMAQCACTPEWVTKQLSSSHERWKSFIRFPTAPMTFCFIPFDFRDMEDDWYSRTMISGTVVFDRKRLIHLVCDPESNYEMLRDEASLAQLGIAESIGAGRAQELRGL